MMGTEVKREEKRAKVMKELVSWFNILVELVLVGESRWFIWSFFLLDKCLDFFTHTYQKKYKYMLHGDCWLALTLCTNQHFSTCHVCELL